MNKEFECHMSKGDKLILYRENGFNFIEIKNRQNEFCESIICIRDNDIDKIIETLREMKMF